MNNEVQWTGKEVIVTSEEIQENPVKMEGLWADIWSQDLPNVKQDY